MTYRVHPSLTDGLQTACITRILSGLVVVSLYAFNKFDLIPSFTTIVSLLRSRLSSLVHAYLSSPQVPPKNNLKLHPDCTYPIDGIT